MNRFRMLAALAAAVALGSIVPGGSPARAQTYDPRYPICLQIYQNFGDYYFECGYTSMPQCQMSASGRAAQCVVNPYYGGPKTTRSKRRVQYQ